MRFLARWCLAVAVGLTVVLPVQSATAEPQGSDVADLAQYWDAERRATAQPRDLVIDHRGLGYLRRADGALEPYGHRQPSVLRVVRPDVTADAALPAAAPGISNQDPAAGATVGVSHTFKATVSDPQYGVRSVAFVIRYPDGRTQSFSASKTTADVWALTLEGFSSGDWGWRIEAKDRGPRGGTMSYWPSQSGFSPFYGPGSSTPPPPPPTGDVVTNAVWTGGGVVKATVGRIFFEMPANSQLKKWNGYVCSGTVVSDGAEGQSLILTAAHCVYDDVNKAFARNVLFIPDQAASGTKTDTNCSNDLYGCWVPSHGVVDREWTTRTWPANIPWDYAFYVVPTSGAHKAGTSPVSSPSLEVAVGTMSMSFDATTQGARTHGFGYSYSEDPKFMYCAEGLGRDGSSLFLPNCGLSGGASGGPWVQPMGTSQGPIVSVNSYGYSTKPGMGGPLLHGTSAQCVYATAENSTTSRDRGTVATCP
jgi:hypothetical protein